MSARTGPSGRCPGGVRQRGVALLTAIILVALATIMAATIAFDNVMTARRSSALFSLDQGLQAAQAAEALAAHELQQDQRGSGARQDHLGERWAQPFGPVEIAPGVLLEARLEDLQGRFNLNDLTKADGSSDDEAIARLARLLEFLNLETKWAALVADWIDSSPEANFPDGAEDSLYTAQSPPYRAPNLAITSVSELLALPGFGRERYRRLAPYVAALPRGTPLNVCTAPGEVLDAAHPTDREYSIDPERLAEERADKCFPTLEQYRQFLDGATFAKLQATLGERSEYYRLASIASIGTAEIALYSLLHRNPDDGGRVRAVFRTYGLE